MHLSWIITFSRNLASSSIFFNKIYQEITELKAQVNRLKEDAKKARDGRKILNLPTRIGSNDQEEIVRYIVRFLKDWQLIMNKVHFDLNFFFGMLYKFIPKYMFCFQILFTRFKLCHNGHMQNKLN